MAVILIIGAGGVGRVTTLKCLESGVFSHVALASRTLEKCHDIASSCRDRISTYQLDASEVGRTSDLISDLNADIVVNVALPYQNMAIMEACLAAGSHYLDTAVPETPERLYTDVADDDWYGPQWALDRQFKEQEMSAVLGAGSDPGMVNAFCTLAAETLLDTVECIDIMDVNAGDHGYAFATNFNPEINLREVQAPAHYVENGTWRQVEPLSVNSSYDFPVIGEQPIYLMDHDELHSLRRTFPEARHIKFWMGFSRRYLGHFETLHALGLLSPEPVSCESSDGTNAEIVPLKLVKELLPDPASLAGRYTGKTCIGALVSGRKEGKHRAYFIYNLCDHEAAYADVGSQAISFTAGTCAAAAAMTMAEGNWSDSGVRNVEQLPPQPFLQALDSLGMEHHILEVTDRYAAP